MEITSIFKRRSGLSNFSLTFGVGLTVAVAALLFSLLAVGMLAFSSEHNAMMIMPMVVAAILSYGLITLAPALMVAEKRGWRNGVRTVAYEAVWIVILSCALSILFPLSEFID